MYITKRQKVFCFILLSFIIVPFQNCSPYRSTTDSFLLNSQSDGNFELGKTLYNKNCASCHGEHSQTTKMGKTPDQIATAIQGVNEMKHLSSLSQEDIKLIAEALKLDLSICEVQENPGHTPMSRLSHNEYNRSVGDLLGVRGDWTSTFPAESYNGFYENEVLSKNTSLALTEAYLQSSSKAVEDLYNNAQAKNNLLNCNSNNQKECATEILNRVGRLAYRGHYSAQDREDLLTVYDKVFAIRGNFDESIQSALRAILINPKFLFKVYKGQSEDVRSFDSLELASRLSFFIWGSIPDAELLSLAENDRLQEKSILKAQVERMMKDGRAEYLANEFGMNWLGIDRFFTSSKQPDRGVFPEFDDALKNDMVTESEMFIHNIFNQNLSPMDLVSGNYTFANRNLASHYGFPTDSLGDTFTRVPLPSDRSGVLTHGTVLTMTSNPKETSIVNRGIWTMERIICEKPPQDVPPGVSSEIPDIDGLNVRQRLAEHRSNPACASCHSVMDPLGYGFENFNAVGKYRDQWSDGFTVDSHGILPSGEEFDSVPTLVHEVVSRGRFQRCFAEHMLTFATGRKLTSEDACTVNRLGARDISDAKSISDLVLAIVNSDPFFKNEKEGE